MTKRFNTPSGHIEVDDETYDGNPFITIKDTEGTATVHLDNYQTYQLAMALLSTIEVDDTRGSK